jgi:Protein of unknown function (DUF1592)/Protein of unknown function (DUF1588)/Protein of unknown function (DUF1587)/Protein of unknown function (DUF1595)/Protein of unknown function (DUF1585)/Ca-dependent carbohydrate-binding module xylan-binding/Planctomycete cytochrome C
LAPIIHNHLMPARNQHSRHIPLRKKTSACLVVLCVWFILPGTCAELVARQQSGSQPNADWNETVVPILDASCVDCHNGDDAAGNLDLSQFKTSRDAARDRRTWRKIADRVEAHQMPPDSGEMDQSDRDRLITWVRQSLPQVSGGFPHHAGPVTIRRLNRDEYANTVRDLFGVRIQTNELFPVDESGYGFNNIGDVLSLSPMLMEKYLVAAESISGEVVRDPARDRIDQFFSSSSIKLVEGSHLSGESIVMSTSGTLTVSCDIRRKGRYRITIEAWGQQAGSEPCKLGLSLDGLVQREFKVRNRRDRPGKFRFETELEAGSRNVQVSFPNDYYNPAAEDRSQRDRNLAITGVRVEGPLDTSTPTEAQSAFLFVTPGGEITEKQAAEKIIRRFAPRAWRRRLKEEEFTRLIELFALSRAEGESFEGSMQRVVQALLISPDFMFRIEALEPEDGSVRALSGFELASAISYFVWGSMPDNELFSLAAKGELLKPEVMQAQCERMIRDGRSRYLVDGFASQWLNLPLLDQLDPDPVRFPEFNAGLRDAMRGETSHLLDQVFRNDAPLRTLFTSDATWVNRELASFYGLPFENLEDTELVRVSVAGSARGGLLTHASILALTSNPSRTSPVKRGKWVLSNLLGDPPPPPSPDVPQLDTQTELTGTLREKMEQHRADPNCAVCHIKMDAIGFSLENYDAIGRFRSEDEGIPVDASGELPAHGTFRGAAELQQLIVTKHWRSFIRCLVEKLFIFAIGRGPGPADDEVIDQITESAIVNHLPVSGIIKQIVISEPFRNRAAVISGATSPAKELHGGDGGKNPNTPER